MKCGLRDSAKVRVVLRNAPVNAHAGEEKVAKKVSTQRMRFDVTPLVGANDVRLGSKRSEVVGLLGAPQDSVQISPFMLSPRDEYTKFGFFCHYDKNGRLAEIEFWEDADVYVFGRHVFSMTCSQLRSLLVEHSPKVRDDDVGSSADDLGLSFSCKDTDDRENSPLESFLVGAVPGDG